MINDIATLALVAWLDQTLQAARFKDYCPNGLQVEGKSRIKHLITGVTASEALLHAAIAQGADALLVHHGWFWKNESPCVRGMHRTRLALTLSQNLNLLAYHLPLDAHPKWGNNAQLAQVLDIEPERNADGSAVNVGVDHLIWIGQLAETVSLEVFAQHVGQRLKRTPLVLGVPERPVKRVAWCTGGAQNMFMQAVNANVDVYITGEASEPVAHIAQETGVGFIGAGHHATERYGVQALGQAIAEQFGLKVEFLDLDNPI